MTLTVLDGVRRGPNNVTGWSRFAGLGVRHVLRPRLFAKRDRWTVWLPCS